MASFSKNIWEKQWESEFDTIASENDKVQDLNINQLKLEVRDRYEKDKKKQQTLNLLVVNLF